MARTSLLHANKRWPEAISAHLWPYAVRYANDCINNTPNMQDPKRQTPYQLYSGSNIDVNIKHWMPFGAPCYVLKSELRDGKPHHKWRERAKVGVFIGRSPVHNKQVALVLDRHTGYVSPQFHVKVDKGFYTLKQETMGSRWQYSTGFKQDQSRASVVQKKGPKNKRAKISPPEGGGNVNILIQRESKG